VWQEVLGKAGLTTRTVPGPALLSLTPTAVPTGFVLCAVLEQPEGCCGRRALAGHRFVGASGAFRGSRAVLPPPGCQRGRFGGPFLRRRSCRCRSSPVRDRSPGPHHLCGFRHPGVWTRSANRSCEDDDEALCPVHRRGTIFFLSPPLMRIRCASRALLPPAPEREVVRGRSPLCGR